MMAVVTVRKLNPAGESVFAYAGEVVERTENVLCLRARWERPALDLGYVVFETGDLFTEWFFADRWYNVFEIHGAPGLKGWYCNITTPAHLLPDSVESRDLLLDLWVGPEGDCRVLDEDEFAACATLDATARVAALQALDDLRALVARRMGPFHVLGDQRPNEGVRA
jgi:predicted RNA-binding protein associated with RNAse of E/G family